MSYTRAFIMTTWRRDEEGNLVMGSQFVEPRPNVKLFIWNDVFVDYTPGIAGAMAFTKEQALKAIRESMLDSVANMDGKTYRQLGWEESVDSRIRELRDTEPHIYDSIQGFWCNGGS